METAGNQSGMLLVDNERAGQAVTMTHQAGNQTGLAMIANYRGELVWKSTRLHPAIKRGLLRAGFTGGCCFLPPSPVGSLCR